MKTKAVGCVDRFQVLYGDRHSVSRNRPIPTRLLTSLRRPDCQDSSFRQWAPRGRTRRCGDLWRAVGRSCAFIAATEHAHGAPLPPPVQNTYWLPLGQSEVGSLGFCRQLGPKLYQYALTWIGL